MKLQRNALSVLEHPTGNEEDDEYDFDSSSGSDICERDNDFCKFYLLRNHVLIVLRSNNFGNYHSLIFLCSH